MVNTVRMDSGRLWAWGLLLFGSGVSIAVNVGHAYVRPVGASVGWAPARWAVVWAVFVPLMLFAAVKGITVIVWPREPRWLLWRWCGALPVACLAGYVSWAHISGLLASVGEDRLVCVLAPLAVDGLMFIGVGGLLATAGGIRRIGPAPAISATAAASPNGSGSRIFSPAGRP